MKKINVFASLLILCTLTSCSLHIKDTNGKDNYSLNTITDENILSPNGVVKIAAVQTSVNGSNVYKAKKYSGVEKIATYKNGFTLYVNNVVKSGNFRICLVCDDVIVKDFAINNSDSFAALDSKTYDLYIAGESAQFEISYFVE